MRQAIVTAFLAPTNHRPARVKAMADAGSITLSWDHALGVEDNHRAAAGALAERFGWAAVMVGGTGSGFAFVTI